MAAQLPRLTQAVSTLGSVPAPLPFGPVYVMPPPHALRDGDANTPDEHEDEDAPDDGRCQDPEEPPRVAGGEGELEGDGGLRMLTAMRTRFDGRATFMYDVASIREPRGDRRGEGARHGAVVLRPASDPRAPRRRRLGLLHPLEVYEAAERGGGTGARRSALIPRAAGLLERLDAGVP